MFNKNKNDKPGLQDEIDRLLKALSNEQPDSELYNTITTRLAALYPLLETKNSSKVSKETWAMIGANLIGIGAIIGHERVHVISTKALGFVMKALR